MTTQPPLFSIITVVFNGAAHLDQTIQSVLGQTCKDLEYVVIDGGSTDGTVEIIKKYSDRIAYWVSEKDRGISDAFNKGVRASKGRVILFLGADDYLHDERVLERVAAALPKMKTPYFFYGDLNYVYKSKPERIHKNYTFSKFRRYNCIPHQAMLLDRWFFDTYGLFDESVRIAMDYEHIARFIRQHQPEYLDLMISCMRRDGNSSDPRTAHEDMDRVRLKYGLASKAEVARDRLILEAKIAVGRLLRLDW